ncbi:hypothetical protein P4E94_18105 [Pontiellaceae bacterium B12219]|nr:hypothetical protein [Pontiellaceae bacterium B12219]
MKKRLLIPILLLLSLIVHAEFRIWESTDGKIWEGEFVALNGGQVVIRDQSGNKAEFSPETLSAADLDYLEKVVPPNLSLDVSRTTDSASGKSEMVKCIASIKKTDTRKYRGELTAVLVVMAEELRTGAFSRAGASTEFKFVLPEKNGVPVVFESDAVKLLKRSNKSGRAYAGYVLVVWDRFGNALAVKSNRDSFLENAVKIAHPKISSR